MVKLCEPPGMAPYEPELDFLDLDIAIEISQKTLLDVLVICMSCVYFIYFLFLDLDLVF